MEKTLKMSANDLVVSSKDSKFLVFFLLLLPFPLSFFCQRTIFFSLSLPLFFCFSLSFFRATEFEASSVLLKRMKKRGKSIGKEREGERKKLKSRICIILKVSKMNFQHSVWTLKRERERERERRKIDIDERQSQRSMATLTWKNRKYWNEYKNVWERARKEYWKN